MFVVWRISDTSFSLERFGSDFPPIQVQSNKIRSETLLKNPFPRKTPEEVHIQSRYIWQT
jgi:hypothetical protein